MSTTEARLLSWGEVLRSTWRLARLSFRISFRRKPLFMSIGLLIYYAILYAIVVYDPSEGFNASDARIILVEIPGTVLAIYLTMDLLARERDHQTLETLFGTASSHYAIWMVRLLALYAVLVATLLVISTVGYFFFAEFPFVRVALNAFLPAFLVANLTFMYSVYVRGANTAAMLASASLFVVLLSAELLAETSFWLFLDPFRPPLGTNNPYWLERVLLNRLGIFAIGCLFAFLGLRRMEQRREASVVARDRWRRRQRPVGEVSWAGRRSIATANQHAPDSAAVSRVARWPARYSPRGVPAPRWPALQRQRAGRLPTRARAGCPELPRTGSSRTTPASRRDPKMASPAPSAARKTVCPSIRRCT